MLALRSIVNQYKVYHINMIKKTLFVLAFIIPLASFGASGAIDTNSDTNLYFHYDLTEGNHSFDGSFSNYPVGEEIFYELYVNPSTLLPNEISAYKKAFEISGNNHSDDLFMYIYRKVEGLQPNTTYKVQFSFNIASDGALHLFGVGGSPGSGVTMKVGVLNKKPESIVIDNGGSGYYETAFDKGNQESGGQDMVVVGNIGVYNHNILSDNFDYVAKHFPARLELTDQQAAALESYEVTTNENGEAWLIAGTDSGFESTTTLFYTYFSAYFSKI